MQYPNIAQPQYAFAPTMPMMATGGKVDAENVRSQGRNKDTMLVHMTPNEVAGLQALAMQHGGSLTINPKTGLPEAGFLEDLLPTIAGIALTVGSGGAIDPFTAAMIVGGGTTVATGDINKGLMAGLGAYGGGSLGGGLSAAGTTAGAASGTVGSSSALAAEAAGNQAAAETARLTAASQQAATSPGSLGQIGQNFAQAGQGVKNLLTGQEGSFGRFIGSAANEKTGQEAEGLGGTMGALRTAGMLAAPSLAPKPFAPPKEETSTYEGPYTPTPRDVRFPTAEDRARIGTSEFQYFTDVNPVPGFQPFSATQTAQPTQMGLAQPIATPMMTDEERRRMGVMTMAKGGSVPQLENGGFVLTKKAVDGLGRGSNTKGQKVASRGLGAIPIKGPGTGTSDSIPTTIDGKHPARISNGEAYVPKDKVKKHGGAKKFYALMKKAERAAA